MRRGNGEGSIIRLAGKRRKPFAVRVTSGWTLEGKQKYKYVGYYEGITEAKKALREYLVNPYNLDTKSITLSEVYQAWEKTASISYNTIKGYKSALNQCNQLHKRKMRDIKIIELETAMYTLTPSMQANFRNVIKHLYKYAIKHEIVEKNLSEFITPDSWEKKQRKPFTSAEIEQIKDFKHKYNNITIILLYTGLRINELLEIEKENVFLKDRYMIGGKKTKAGKNRIIPIHDKIYDLVAACYNNSNKYLIENDGKPVVYRTFMTVYWQRLKEYLNTDKTPHCTRHTFITQADVNGLNKTIVKKIVGHSTADITDHYTHKGIQELLYEINKLKY